MLNSYICTLDIGSSKITACVAEIKRRKMSNIFFESVLSSGIEKGAIVDSAQLIGSIGKLMKNLKAKSGINIKSLYANISGQDVVTRHSRAIIPLAEKGNKLITISDIQRADKQARILGSSLEDEIIHLIPFGYSIDSKSNIINPLGLYSHRLEADLYLVCARLSSVQSLGRVINQLGYEIKDLFFSGLATAEAVLHKEIKKGLNLLCDIGADTTELSLFRNGVLCAIEILPFGGNDFTAQLQEALKISFDLAEDIKRSSGIIANPGHIGEDKEILVKQSTLYKPIKQRLVSEIIASGARSACSKIKEAVEKRIPLYQINNFLTVGRTVLLEGFIETLENTLTIPVRVGRLRDEEAISLIKQDNKLSGQKYLTYITALGMIDLALQKRPAGILAVNQPAKSLLTRAVNKFKEAYQEYF